MLELLSNANDQLAAVVPVIRIQVNFTLVFAGIIVIVFAPLD
jgi:hypothetical protein